MDHQLRRGCRVSLTALAPTRGLLPLGPPEQRYYNEVLCPFTNVLVPKACCIVKDMARRLRWQAKAPWQAPSISKTFAASVLRTEDSALLLARCAAWRACALHLGEECPWELDACLF